MKVVPSGPFNSPARSGLIRPIQDFRIADDLATTGSSGQKWPQMLC